MVVNDNERLNGAIIQNERSKERTASDVQGSFFMKTIKGDSLITRLLNYKTDTLVVVDPDNIVIRLNQMSKMLKEVVIRDSMSPLEKYNNNRKEYKSIYTKGDKSGMLFVEGGTEAGAGLNIDKVYNALSKEGKDARRLQKSLTGEYQNNVVDRRFNKTLVSRITGYEGDKLNDFILKNRPSYRFVSKASDYDIIAYIKEKMAADLK
jgi:hypothetical protein